MPFKDFLPQLEMEIAHYPWMQELHRYPTSKRFMGNYTNTDHVLRNDDSWKDFLQDDGWNLTRIQNWFYANYHMTVGRLTIKRIINYRELWQLKRGEK